MIGSTLFTGIAQVLLHLQGNVVQQKEEAREKCRQVVR